MCRQSKCNVVSTSRFTKIPASCAATLGTWPSTLGFLNVYKYFWENKMGLALCVLGFQKRSAAGSAGSGPGVRALPCSPAAGITPALHHYCLLSGSVASQLATVWAELYTQALPPSTAQFDYIKASLKKKKKKWWVWKENTANSGQSPFYLAPFGNSAVTWSYDLS